MKEPGDPTSQVFFYLTNYVQIKGVSRGDPTQRQCFIYFSYQLLHHYHALA